MNDLTGKRRSVFVVISQDPTDTFVVGAFTREEPAIATAQAEVAAALYADVPGELNDLETFYEGDRAIRRWEDPSGQWSVWYEETRRTDLLLPYRATCRCRSDAAWANCTVALDWRVSVRVLPKLADRWQPNSLLSFTVKGMNGAQALSATEQLIGQPQERGWWAATIAAYNATTGHMIERRLEAPEIRRIV